MTEHPIPKRSNRMWQSRPEICCSQIRVFHRRARGRRGPRYLLKCGCCEERVEIYYGDGMLEINGVIGSAQDWREILFPLLADDVPEGEFDNR